ncbi:unnamed protein product [Paramecium octaurelia]|uniref:Uncharacterized protein n=1 Tax=Paramecium octaurelia TaxID=43137 RepID=A0A8S1VE50_PAROT|nr:unnamed protein product [Paramecium octaurelia]
MKSMYVFSKLYSNIFCQKSKTYNKKGILFRTHQILSLDKIKFNLVTNPINNDLLIIGLCRDEETKSLLNFKNTVYKQMDQNFERFFCHLYATTNSYFKSRLLVRIEPDIQIYLQLKGSYQSCITI